MIKRMPVFNGALRHICSGACSHFLYCGITIISRRSAIGCYFVVMAIISWYGFIAQFDGYSFFTEYHHHELNEYHETR